MYTKTPSDTARDDSGIRITRHCLERIAERFEKNSLNEVLSVVSIYLSNIFVYKKRCIKQIEDNKFVLLSNEAYVVVEAIYKSPMEDPHHQLYDFIIKTIIPRHCWSKRRTLVLKNAVEAINSKSVPDLQNKAKRQYKGVGALLVLKPSSINDENITEAEFTEDDFLLWHHQ